MSRFFNRRRKSLQGNIPSALYLLEWAALLVVIFVVAHLAGLRDFTSVLNGTIGSTSMDWRNAAILGVAYVLIYLGAVLVAPILVIGAVILRLWKKVIPTKGTANEPGTNAPKS